MAEPSFFLYPCPIQVAMKKIALLVIMALCLVISLPAQNNPDDFIGYWTSDGTNTECVIWKDKHGQFQYVEWDKHSGQSLEILNLKLENGKLLIRTRFKETNWVVSTELTLTSEYNITAKIVGDAKATVYYKKLK